MIAIVHPSRRRVYVRRFDHEEAARRHAAGESQSALAREYGVTQVAVSKAIRGLDPTRRLADDDPRHGTVSGYGNHGCRCDACRRAWSAHHVEWSHRTGRSRPLAEVIAERRAEADARDNHGTETRYSRGCRCDECRAAAAAAKRRRRRATRVPCSHGCGRFVNGINRDRPEKPPECRSCATKRAWRERRQVAA